MRSGRVTIRLRWRRMKPKPDPELPSEPPTAQAELSPPQPVSKEEAPVYRWYHKLLGLFAVIFCFELGVFLMVFPWASDWDLNYFSSLPLWASTIWASPYFRGAVSGLGVLNIYVSLIEV